MTKYKPFTHQLYRCAIAVILIASMQSELRVLAEPDFGSSGQSGVTGPGGSRGKCALTRPPIALTPLIPQPKGAQTARKEVQTVSAHPTVWVYNPYTAPTAKTIKFVLQTPAGEEIYNANLPIPTQPGIVSITVPEQKRALEIGKTYEWYYTVDCSNDGDQPDTAVDSAKIIPHIQRVAIDPALQKQIAAAKTPIERSQAYAKAGIWYEALTILANELKQKPNDPALRKEWSKLLKYSTVNLGEFESQPFLP